MLNNFIGGGQVFLHKIRMLKQVIGSVIFVSLLSGILVSWFTAAKYTQKLDLSAAMSYQKANMSLYFDIASRLYKNKAPVRIDAYSNSKLWKKNVSAQEILNSNKFKKAWEDFLVAIYSISLLSLSWSFGAGIMLIIIWSGIGRALKTEKIKEGSNKILTEKEVRKFLKKSGRASDIKIGKMPLIKGMETRHFLITGSTGSGKTNLMHNILPQVEKRQNPAFVLDNTGEMIAKYYNPDRGDIIFNPFDARSHAWDFWADCSNVEELERFSKILFGFNRKKNMIHSDPFWEQSAEIVFNCCVKYLVKNNKATMHDLKRILTLDNSKLKIMLKNTEAERYLCDEAKTMGASVLSSLITSTRPLNHLKDTRKAGKFSLKEHFKKIDQGSMSWLFLSTKPSSRELTQTLNACLMELALCELLDIGIKENRRLWFVIDELSSLGKLPAFATLMSEGRKYGASIICGLQSLNQIYSLYGHHEGSTIFGQFGTNFFFRNSEPAIAKLIGQISGTETIKRHQQNTSFGASEIRDGQSFTEQEQKKSLIEYNDLSKLSIGECFVFFQEAKIAVAKIKVPESNIKQKNEGFVYEDQSLSLKDQDNNLPIDDKDDNPFIESSKKNTESEADSNDEFTEKKDDEKSGDSSADSSGDSSSDTQIKKDNNVKPTKEAKEKKEEEHKSEKEEKTEEEKEKISFFIGSNKKDEEKSNNNKTGKDFEMS